MKPPQVRAWSAEDGSAPPARPGPRAVRVSVGPTAAHAGVEPIVVEPSPVASAAAGDGTGERSAAVADDLVLVDGRPLASGLDRRGDRAEVTVGQGRGADRHRLVLLDAPGGPPGARRFEAIVDGWRVEVEVEPERRAALRQRASRSRAAAAHGGPVDVRAIIPGRVVSVAVVPGDAVTAGQQLLAIEAMKMQNELRAPRDGRIERVAVAVGQTIEVGDVLVVIE